MYNKKRKYTKLILIFVIAPLVSITLGFALTKKIIIPYFNKDLIASSSPDKEGSNNGKLNQMSLYNIEIEDFEDLEDSENYLNKLNNEGILAYISRLDNYVVCSFLTFDKKDVTDQINKIKESYPRAKTNSINIDSKQINVEEAEKELLDKVVNTANILNNSYRKETKLWLDDMMKTDYSKVRAEIDKNNKEINKSMESYLEIFLEGTVESEELKTLYLMLAQNVKTREKIVSEFHNKDLENVKNTYYEFIKTLFTYVNYHNM